VNETDIHVYPVNQEHDSSPQCWCQPAISYRELTTGGRVWLHRRAHDLPHREKENPASPENGRAGESGDEPHAVSQLTHDSAIVNCDHRDSYGSTIIIGLGPIGNEGPAVCILCDQRAPFLRLVS
jgi:hypothetical protein